MPVAVLGSSIYFDEISGSPENIKAGRFATENPINRSTTRRGRILWSQIDAFLAECLPAAPNFPGQHPGVSYLYVSDVSIEPEVDRIFDCSSAVNTYATAIATVTYSPLDYTPDRIVRSSNFSMEMMNIPFSHLYWANEDPDNPPPLPPITAGNAILGEIVPNPDVMAYKYIPVVEHSYQFQNVPVASYTTILTAIRENLGKVNSDVFDDYPRETMLFAGGRISYTFGNLGFQTYSFDYSFHEKNNKEQRDDGAGGFNEYSFGWNHFYRGNENGSGKWDRLSRNQFGYLPIYEGSDTFADLFSGTTI